VLRLCAPAYRIFGNPHDGLTPRTLKTRLNNLGVVVNDAEVAQLVKKFDTRGRGRVEWDAFVKVALPPDYAEKTWSIKRDEEMEKQHAHQAKMAEPVPDWPTSLNNNRLTVKQYIALIRTKILERTKRPSDQYREGDSVVPAALVSHAQSADSLDATPCSVPPFWQPP